MTFQTNSKGWNHTEAHTEDSGGPTEAIEGIEKSQIANVVEKKAKNPFLPLLLLLQNALISLLTSHTLRSKKILDADRYDPRTAVFLTELVKLLFSFGMDAYTRSVSPWDFVTEQISSPYRRQEVALMSVPGVIYTVQNNLLYVALKSLSAPTYVLTYQLKILSTALFSSFFFSRRLSPTKLLSLLLLTAGVVLVQLSDSGPITVGGEDKMTGLVAIGIASLGSGVAGVWFEWMLKRPQVVSSSTVTREQDEKERAHKKPDTVWTKNVQLALPSIIFAAAPLIMRPPDAFWKGYTTLVYLVILIQSLGGILVSLIVRDFSSVTKGFITSGSIVLTSAGGMYTQGFWPSGLWTFGASMVVCATALWSMV